MALPALVIANYITSGFPAPLNRLMLSTPAPVESEILSALTLYSEVTELGKDLLKLHGHSDLKHGFARFQAYMRQARTFYEAATHLHYRASPLLYYYSFMNLAKAVIFIHDPTFKSGHISHGLHPAYGNGLKGSSVTTPATPGVYGHLYRYVTGRVLPGRATMKIASLLGYVNDVIYELRSFKLGAVAATPCSFAIAKFVGSQEFHGVVVSHRRLLNTEARFSRIMTRSFSEFSMSQSSWKEVFEYTNPQFRGLRAWKTKKTYMEKDGLLPVPQIIIDVNDNLRPFISFIPRDEKAIFSINLPIKTPNEIPINEMLAVYAVMFYLGSTVRYRPDVLEKMLGKKDAWMIESFLRSVPTTFLRHARNLLDGNYIAYQGR